MSQKYELAAVYARASSYETYSTNISELENLFNELQMVLPAHGQKAKDIYRDKENPFKVYFPRRNDVLKWWLLNWFLERGWEPFSHTYNEDIYSFRRITGDA